MILMPTHHLGWTCQLSVLSSFPNARATTIFPPNSHQTCRASGQLTTYSEPDLQVSWDSWSLSTGRFRAHEVCLLPPLLMQRDMDPTRRFKSRVSDIVVFE